MNFLPDYPFEDKGGFKNISKFLVYDCKTVQSGESLTNRQRQGDDEMTPEAVFTDENFIIYGQ
jgi:hypothetical protein